jgi:phosphoglycerol transferase MdoB-like AlkP superfamily enzyme
VGLYQAQRAVFLIYNSTLFANEDIFSVLLTFIVGLRFDLSTIAILSVPAFAVLIIASFLKQSQKINSIMIGIFFIFQFPLLAVNFSDSEFIHFLGRRMTFHTFQLFSEIQAGSSGLATVLYAWKLFLFSVVIFVGYLFLINRLWKRYRNHKLPFQNRWSNLAVIFILLIVSARGGLQSKPLNFAHAQVFSAPALNMAVTNTGFSVLQTIKRVPLERDQFFKSNSELISYLNGSVKGRSLLDGLRPKKSQNVVLIILESFNFDYMGKPFGDKGFTPFLDELSQKALFLENAYANSRRSIEGIASIMAGIPSLMTESFINSQYVANYFWGVGTLLAEKNYESAFFHGAMNGTMYFDRFMESAGVQHYYGLDQYPVKTDHDGTWGIWDEPFLQWSGQKISQMREPFFASIFTLSSHHPFNIPTQFKNKFPKGGLDILESIGYTDLALKNFFEFCKIQKWYSETLFVVVADHTYKNFRTEYKNTLGKFRIPILFYHPTIDLRSIKNSEPVSQIDILPSILDFLDVPLKEQNYLGRSIFIPGPRNVTLYDEGAYFTVMDNYVLRWVRGKTPEMFQLTDLDLKNPMQDLTEQKTKLENTQKATLQYFSQGMWDNRLYYPSQ